MCNESNSFYVFFDSSAVFDCGIAFEGSSDWITTIEDFTNGIKLDPDFEAAYYMRGGAHRARGNHSQADKDFAEAKRIRILYWSEAE
jgi:tetratricopeptide (TPR) repeat protein